MSCCDSCAKGGPCGAPALGQLTPADCLAQGMVLDLASGKCVPLQIPGAIPGRPGVPAPPGAPVVTAQECNRRELAAFEQGKNHEAARFVKTTVVAAGISAVVGIIVGRVLG